MNTKALHKISYGMYIVTSKTNEKTNGQMANSVFQVASDPPVIAVSIHKDNFTRECIDVWHSFAVSVLSRDAPLSLIGRFGFHSGRDMDKMTGIKQKNGLTGVPIILEHTLAYVEVRVTETLNVGTHLLYMGKIVDAGILDNGEVMTYEYYHNVKRGTLSKKATHYVKEEKE